MNKNDKKLIKFATYKVERKQNGEFIVEPELIEGWASKTKIEIADSKNIIFLVVDTFMSYV
ncbi:MAG: hypothetical protein Q9M91_05990 [Candidatus Dojkabacteria bacterium]|nr:hypothetical protein [Candidatus Dojkabacteria bacterium]MDQ7021350.1 hypothetical protein [Candidatus Dojkabacteria bacterium]